MLYQSTGVLEYYNFIYTQNKNGHKKSLDNIQTHFRIV